MKSLPARRSDDLDFDEAIYIVALDGVTLWSLMEAVKSIIRGGLGHSFFPAPPEFRMHCNALMQPVYDRFERLERERRDREENASVENLPPRTEAERQRARELMARFNESCADVTERAGKSEADELAEIRNKYDPELLAAVPDRVESSTFKRLK